MHTKISKCRKRFFLEILQPTGISRVRWLHNFKMNHWMSTVLRLLYYRVLNLNCRILTNKEIYASVKKPTIIETIRLNKLRWFGHVQRVEGNRIPKRVLYMNLGTTRFKGRPRNRWQDEVREDGRIVGGEGWQEKVHNREEWKKLLRTARNCRILHMPLE